ncbi:phosphoribosylglycinamide formyltransferase [Wenzhouxiangella sp. 15181]|nr:phosphoribosylglycinamide formyltransferase [Wenzhouxiangella sp. 15181]RFP67592.1 phosphoribosylglycinamide formyltransferase [Wenzhouxiangella sp. 15190]
MSDVSAGDLPRLVILLSGRGSNFRAIHDAIVAGKINAEIAAVISDRPDAPGLQLAADAGIDTVTLERARFAGREAFERGLETAIAGFEPKYVVLAGFMRVLGADFVNRHLGSLINIHPSLLPRHRGLNTHQRVLDAGEREHGASVHFVTPALDAGPVLSRVTIDVRDDDDADMLADRLLPLEHRLYPATLALLLNHRVELRHETIQIDDQALDRPLDLDRDLDPDGHLLDHRHGG